MTRFAVALFVGLVFVFSLGCKGDVADRQCAQWEISYFMMTDLEKMATNLKVNGTGGTLKEAEIRAMAPGWEPFAVLGVAVVARRCVK